MQALEDQDRAAKEQSRERELLLELGNGEGKDNVGAKQGVCDVCVCACRAIAFWYFFIIILLLCAHNTLRSVKNSAKLAEELVSDCSSGVMGN